MSSKYVPPSMRDAAKKTPMPLVNTSIPAKEAPKLAPATLASLTTSGDIPSVTHSMKTMNLEKVSIYKGNEKKGNLTQDDFPSLGKASTTKAPVKPVMNFAEKAREWALKQQEDARLAAEEAEKERARLHVEKMMREKEEQEEKRFKKTMITLSSIKKTDELEEEKRIYDEDSIEEEEPYESPLEEEEEEEHEEYQSHWDGRRYHDEL